MGRFEAVWLDSDVLLDWLAGRQPWDLAAVELIERAIQGEWALWFSPLTVANVFYVYRKQAGATRAIRAITAVVRIGNIAALEAVHVEQALASGRSDFEDEMQIACATRIPQITAIVTRNLSDYRHASLPAFTAENWIQGHPRLVPEISSDPA